MKILNDICVVQLLTKFMITHVANVVLSLNISLELSMNFSFAHASDAPMCSFLFCVGMGYMSIFWICDEYGTMRYRKGFFFPN